MQRGFTLTELLIVIAILGVLASVVLNSVQDARNKGIDAKIKGELNLVAKRAAFSRNELLDYDEVCGSNGQTQDAEIVPLLTSVDDISGGTSVCNSDTDTFAISAPLVDGDHWCIDSTGISREIGSALGGGVLVCPAS